MNSDLNLSNASSINSIFTKRTCPVCASKKFSDFFKVLNFPVEEGVLFDSKDEAFNCVRGDIKLSFCSQCGYIGNRSFIPENIKFDDRYNVSLHYSPLYQEFINNLALRLINHYDLNNKTVIEIGCGKGEFLKILCRFGKNIGIGFDPTFVDSEDEDEISEKITFIQDYYSERYFSYKADFICCRHVLDIVGNPKEFLCMIRKALTGNRNSAVYFEVPNGSYTFRDLAIWNIAYENCSYFYPESLEWLFRLCGFKVSNVTPCFEENQYLGFEAVPHDEEIEIDSMSGNSINKIIEDLENFGEKHRRKMSFWRERLESIKKSGSKVIALGAGARAINFFNIYEIKKEVPYVVDINPNKQGKYMPGTGQQVVAPDFIIEYQPDIVIVTNPTFEMEIKEKVKKLGFSCNFVTL